MKQEGENQPDQHQNHCDADAGYGGQNRIAFWEPRFGQKENAFDGQQDDEEAGWRGVEPAELLFGGG